VRLPLAPILLLATSAPVAPSQEIRGVWKPVEILVRSGPDSGRHTSDVQPGLLIFTNGYYSFIIVEGFAARPMLSANPTDEERGRACRPFVANAGTYALTDSGVSFTPSVAKNPGGMRGTPLVAQVRVLADTLWFTVRGSRGIENRSKWVKVEGYPSR
jgi:hypothetical protein